METISEKYHIIEEKDADASQQIPLFVRVHEDTVRSTNRII